MTEQSYMPDLAIPEKGSDEDIRQLLMDLPWCVTRDVGESVKAIVERMQQAEKRLARTERTLELKETVLAAIVQGVAAQVAQEVSAHA